MKRALVIGLLAISLLVVSMAQASHGIAQSVSAPAALPSMLPVFQLAAPPAVGPVSVQVLARNFPGIGGNQILSETTFARSLSFSTVNTATGVSLQQFAATGGFFATNFQRAFSETRAMLDYSPSWVCNMLSSKNLFPKGFSDQSSNCQGTLPYEVTPIYLSILTPTLASDALNSPAATGAISELVPIGEVYRVPLAINVGAAAPNYIPLGGPGGHLSILLTGFGDGISLDAQYPGLNAIASPMNGRATQRTIGQYPVVSQQAALDQVRASLPAGTVITPGNPGLVYYIEHPAVTQTVMMPMWVFTDTQANINGQEVDLKGMTVPGVQGFLPDVRIVSPVDDTIYFPGQPLQVTGVISGAAGPFTYTLQVEGGSVLTTGVAPSGTLPLALASVPFPVDKGSSSSVVLRLSVEDTNGAVSQDTVLLQAPRYVYLPVMLRDSVTGFMSLARGNTPAQPNAAFTMGVEWVQYYNGTNPDLPGVPPDANGLYGRLASLGWTGRFNYGNNSAWEKDWRDCSLGGIDCTYGVDRAEFVYFSGHGSPARMYFGVNKDAYSFFGGNARFQNVRWAGFSSCQTLRGGPYVSPGNPPVTNWFNAFQGAYMLLGFHSNMGDIAFGGPLIDNMKLPMLWGIFPLYAAQPTVRDAWVMTAFQMNAGKPAYLYAVGNFNPVDLKLPAPIWNNYATPPLTNIYQYRWVWWN